MFPVPSILSMWGYTASYSDRVVYREISKSGVIAHRRYYSRERSFMLTPFVLALIECVSCSSFQLG